MSTTVTVSEEISSAPARVPTGGRTPAVGERLVVGAEVGAGGFGVVSRCESVAGTATPTVLVKRHSDGQPGPEQHAAVIAALHRAIDRTPGTVRDGRLRAVPFWVGRVEWSGRTEVVSLLEDLTPQGFASFESITSDDAGFRTWISHDVADRLAVAVDAADEHAACEALGYVHADINGENLFVDIVGGRASLIDHDSGWLPGAPGTGPLVWGKPNEFIAPEVKRGGQLNQAAVGVESERWAVGMLLHRLLFGFGPLFFLSTISEESIGDYLRSFTWPDIDTSSALFNHPNRTLYTHYLQSLAELPPAAAALFQRFVTDGALDPSERPTSAEWRDALEDIGGPPTFERIDVSPTSTFDVHPVLVEWSARGAANVTVDGDGPFPGVGSTSVSLTRSRAIRLVASNPFGSVERETPAVIVYRAPSVPTVDVAVPRLRVPPLPSVLTPASPGAPNHRADTGSGSRRARRATGSRQDRSSGRSSTSNEWVTRPGKTRW